MAGGGAGQANGDEGKQDPAHPNAPDPPTVYPEDIDGLSREESKEINDLADIAALKSNTAKTWVRPSAVIKKKATKKLEKNEGLFKADKTQMNKSKMDDIDKPPYDVRDFYHNNFALPGAYDGVVTRVSCSGKFENMTFMVIAINALWMGFDSDFNPEPTLTTAHPTFQYGENFFCIYFTFEVMIRFMSFKNKRNCVKDNWFNFDTCLVTLMTVETWALPIILGDGQLPFDVALLRLLRLLRLARMVRLLRGLPELLTLVQAMAAAIRSVSTVIALLVLIMYVFAIIFKMQMGEKMPDNFGGIPISMGTLFLAGTLGDNIGDVFLGTVDESEIMGVVFLIYVFLAMFTVLNMLIGVLCEVVAAVSEASKEETLIDFVRKELREVLDEHDDDGNGMVSRSEFKAIVTDERGMQAFADLEVDVDNFESMSSTIFDPDKPEDPDKEIPFADFLKRVLSMRNTNSARYADVIEVNKLIMRGQMDMESLVLHVEHEIGKRLNKIMVANGLQADTLDDDPLERYPVRASKDMQRRPSKDRGAMVKERAVSRLSGGDDGLEGRMAKLESNVGQINGKLDQLLSVLTMGR
jgi:voltage-gated sodium channel